MNRQIKFRGKIVDSVKKGQWEYGSLLNNPEKECLIWSEERELFVKVDPETLGQFTGLKDKNGVGIYEGDVIQLYQCPDTLQQVIFKRGAFGYMVDFLRSFVPLSHMEEVMGDNNVEWIIINNIHDKPELLTDK